MNDDDKRALLTSTDVFVAPHRERESFGVVLVEALASGADVVASDLPAFTDLLRRDGQNLGRLVPVGDRRALARAVVDRITGRAPSAQPAASAAVRRYDWSVVGAAITDVYRAVLRSGQRPTAVSRWSSPPIANYCERMLGAPPRPLDASMDLLNQIARTPYDPDYAVVAARGEPRPGRRWVLALVAVLVGGLFALAAVQTTRQAPALAGERSDLIARIQAAETEQDQLRHRAAELTGEINTTAHRGQRRGRLGSQPAGRHRGASSRSWERSR